MKMSVFQGFQQKKKKNHLFSVPFQVSPQRQTFATPLAVASHFLLFHVSQHVYSAFITCPVLLNMNNDLFTCLLFPHTYFASFQTPSIVQFDSLQVLYSLVHSGLSIVRSILQLPSR